MKTFSLAVLTIVATLMWAQAPPGGNCAAKGKAGKATADAKGKAAQEIKAPTRPPVPQVLRLVRANTYLITGHGNNSVFRVTPRGVILVDTKLSGAGDYERLTELIRGITPQAVRFNTSAKADASGNNAKFQAAGAELISSERTLAEARSIRTAAGMAVFFPGEKLLVLGDAARTDPAVAALDWTLAIPAAGEPVYR